jgi:hypothetical protein
MIIIIAVGYGNEFIARTKTTKKNNAHSTLFEGQVLTTSHVSPRKIQNAYSMSEHIVACAIDTLILSLSRFMSLVCLDHGTLHI